MKRIKKYNSQNESNSFLGKLSSYSALAAAAIACPLSMAGQCGTATVGGPLGVDLDGDGTADVNIGVASFPGPYLITSGTNSGALGTSTIPVSYSFTFTVVPPGPGTSWNGCITTNYNGGFTAIDPNATAMGPIQVTGSTRLYSQSYISYYAIVYNATQAYAIAAPGNAIIGLTAAGSSICPASPGTVTGAALGTQFCYSNVFTYLVVGGVYRNLVPSGTVTLDHPPCTTTGGNYYAGLVQQAYFLPLTIMSPGPYLLAGPYNGTSYLSCNATPGPTYLGVTFIGGDGDTYNGWIEVTYNADGTVTCVDNGYQQCSVEMATEVGDPTLSCIATGEATNSSAGCVLPVCTLTAGGEVVSACDDGGTSDDPSDDTYTFTVNPTGTDLGATYTVSGGAAAGGLAYGAPSAPFGPFLISAGAVTVTITDDADPDCTLEVTITPPLACSNDAPCDADAGTFPAGNGN